MKKVIQFSCIGFFVFFCFTSTISIAQNYEAIKTDASYYFYDSVKQDIIVARIDSVTEDVEQTRYFGMRQIRQTDYSCYIPDGHSWLGYVITENPESIFRFIVYPFSPPDSADVFTILSKSKIGQSWRFYNYHFFSNFGTQYIEAKVTQISLSNFLGLSDSVKTITLQQKNASGENVSNPINGQKILLSQNYGLIRLPKFDEFKENLRFLDLCGKTNPSNGITNLTFEEIFDFQTGDEFHIAYDDETYEATFPNENGYIIQRVLERINGSNSDTVSYKIEECKTSTQNIGINQQIITNIADTIDFTYIKAQYPDFICDPNEPQISTSSAAELNENLMGLSATPVLEHDEIPWKQINADWPLWSDEFQHCWNYPMIEYSDFSVYYFKGLGGPFHYEKSNPSFNYRKLVYYKKGSESWGTPFNCETLLHVSLPKSIEKQNVNIYPNPTSGKITIELPADVSTPCKLGIVDIAGRLTDEFAINFQTQTIDLSNLPCGLYSYKLTVAKGEVFRGIIIRQ
ncbi:MAG: T9SS type A sorting domain-containing protein [Bacteroidales bacterium]|nr:T9SS type A sorting domain-containing protein [Bacteroidales bacterium]